MKTLLPYLLIAGGVLALVGLALYWYFGGEEYEEDEEGKPIDPLAVTGPDALGDTLTTTRDELRRTARASRMIKMKESLERSLDSRSGGSGEAVAGRTLSAKDRMTMPWFMLVGADGSGKKTILANTGLELPFGEPIEVDSVRKDAGKWWFFEHAIVLEAPAAAPGATVGAQTLPPGQTVADTSLGWNTLLHMLRKDRPDAPLNGIIVTISCAELMNARANPDRMEEQADRIKNFLEKTRNFLGVRLPMHVLVTKCDVMAGFRGFANSLPEARKDDIFGWSNPANIESRFSPGWVDKGFESIMQKLEVLRDEVLAAPEHIRDSVGVFLFDSEFADLQEPLKAFITRLVDLDERRPSLFLRGFYFTGNALETAAKPTMSLTGATMSVTAEEQQQADTLSEKVNTLSESTGRSKQIKKSDITGETHDLVFLKSVFGEKIFKEAGLARPFSKWRLARDRRVVMAQAAAILISIGGSAGLWTAVNGYQQDSDYRAGLKAKAEALTRVLSGIVIDLDEVSVATQQGGSSNDPLVRRTRDAAVIEFVSQVREVPSMKMRSAFIPTSWFSSLPKQISESMMKGVQDIVLPITRLRLEERAQSLLTPRTPEDSAISNELSADDPRSLTTYLSDVRVLSRNIARYNTLAKPNAGSVKELAPLLDYLFGEEIATDSTVATPEFEDALNRASAKAITISPQMAAAVVQRSVGMIKTVAGKASRQLAPRATAAQERAVDPRQDLDALNALASLVQLLDPKTGVVASVSDSAILGVRLARAVEDSIRLQLRVVADQIAPRDTISPDAKEARLRSVLAQLYAFRLMDPIEGKQISNEVRPAQRLRWDMGRLEQGIALRQEFTLGLAVVAQMFPGQQPDRMRKALEVQLRARAIDVAASAQRFTPSAFASDPTGEIKASGENLETAASRIFRLKELLDTLGATNEAHQLLSAAVRQAEQGLAMSQYVFEKERYLTPRRANVAAWTGILPLSHAIMNVTDSLSFAGQLALQETAIRTLAFAVRPSIVFLRKPQVPDSMIVSRQLLSDWESIANAVAKYDKGDAQSTLGALHRFIREGLIFTDVATCATAAAQPDTTRPSTDVFVIRRRQFRAVMVSRCSPAGATEAVAAYQKMRTYFQSKLAGRYPFVDTTVKVPADADLLALKDFLRQYDAFAVTNNAMLRSDPQYAQVGKPVIAFLDQVAQLREFMGAFVEGETAIPAFKVLVSRGGTTLPDSVPADLRLLIGAREVPLDENLKEQLWRSGESVQVMLTPMDTSKARPVFVAGGPWAMLRLAQDPKGYAAVKFYDPETTMELPLPPFPTFAPELLPPKPAGR